MIETQTDPPRPHLDDPAAGLVVLATTFRDASAERRDELAGLLAGLDPAPHEAVVVETCHRVELIRVGGSAPAPVADVQATHGRAAVERVFVVTAGFDSTVLAEEQILGQVRDAYETALARGRTGPITNELMRRAIRFGKRVRTEARPGTDRSLADRAAGWIGERAPTGGTALVAGTGEMGRILARRLADAGMRVSVASRTQERAGEIVTHLGPGAVHGTALLPAALRRAAAYDVVAIAVRSAASRLELADLDGARHVPLVVDLSAPPAVDPAARERLGDRLLDLDRLGAAPSSAPFPPAVERRLRAELEAEVDRFMAWLLARSAGDGVALLRQYAEEIRRRHLERLHRRGMLDTDQAAAVEAATAAMLGELLHVPTVELRRSTDAARRVRQVFGIDR